MQRAAERDINQEIAPFTGFIDYDTTFFESFNIILNRPLTAEEGEELQVTPFEELWDYFRPKGGRLIPYSSGSTPENPLGGTWEKGSGTWGTAVFNMTLRSESTSMLTILDMTPVPVSCEDPTAVTVINLPPQGTEYYSGVVVNLNHNDPVFYSTDEGPNKGKPFFENAHINVGGGATSGGLRVEAQVDGQSCKWEIRAEYVDAQNQPGEVILRDGDKPFFVEVAPSQPEQYWVAIPRVPDFGLNFMPCHEREHSYCPPRQ
ncbi:hypothetical protein [Nocardiopsis sp. NPDC055824]